MIMSLLLKVIDVALNKFTQCQYLTIKDWVLSWWLSKFVIKFFPIIILHQNRQYRISICFMIRVMYRLLSWFLLMLRLSLFTQVSLYFFFDVIFIEWLLVCCRYQALFKSCRALMLTLSRFVVTFIRTRWWPPLISGFFSPLVTVMIFFPNRSIFSFGWTPTFVPIIAVWTPTVAIRILWSLVSSLIWLVSVIIIPAFWLVLFFPPVFAVCPFWVILIIFITWWALPLGFRLFVVSMIISWVWPSPVPVIPTVLRPRSTLILLLHFMIVSKSFKLVNIHYWLKLLQVVVHDVEIGLECHHITLRISSETLLLSGKFLFSSGRDNIWAHLPFVFMNIFGAVIFFQLWLVLKVSWITMRANVTSPLVMVSRTTLEARMTFVEALWTRWLSLPHSLPSSIPSVIVRTHFYYF